ncbi:RNA polymerase sigma factor [Bacillus sp. NEB1478]|uniref:RNA polymerase sigma factor n=1 Tax=Bacillus sp. NEB1478 TaxID=3073816 RepID=UPI002873C62F|nr:RNA polymerase sigma factor [Bacillus sp. NEB1478]WNB91198.1 RNA polymerase sigma factor [Bacillus sp. NEB1478]
MTAIHDSIKHIDFTEIYQMFYRKVYSIAIRISRDAYLAEDIIQETFIKAYKNLHTIVDTQKIGAWLSAIASHTAIDFMRKGKKSNETLTDYSTFNGIEIKWVKKNLIVRESSWFSEQEIYEKIQRLKQNERKVFILKYVEGLKEEEIASQLQISRGAVKSRLFRVRQKVKAELLKSIK